MPKLELKAVQRELEQGVIWPVYWLYGPEKLKSRELLKRIRFAVLGQEGSTTAGQWNFNEEVFEGNEIDATSVLDSVRSPSLIGGVRLILVREAHAMKNPEVLSELFGAPTKLSELMSVCVCISKDLDGRKKFSKALVEGAAVVSCEEVIEVQREPWIQYLAQRRGVELNSTLVTRLSGLDPWSLDIIEQELEKFVVAGSSPDVILDSLGLSGVTERFIEDFFSRDLEAALPLVSRFADSPDESLPLLGLIGWNVRQLAIWLADRDNGTRNSKLNPYAVERFRKWSPFWKQHEVIELQARLSELDFQLKQTPLLPLGLWSSLVLRFCSKSS